MDLNSSLSTSNMSIAKFKKRLSNKNKNKTEVEGYQNYIADASISKMTNIELFVRYTCTNSTLMFFLHIVLFYN